MQRYYDDSCSAAGHDGGVPLDDFLLRFFPVAIFLVCADYQSECRDRLQNDAVDVVTNTSPDTQYRDHATAPFDSTLKIGVGTIFRGR